MKTLIAIILTVGLLATAGFAQPTITQVSNAASQALSPLQNSSIAQGSYFAIYGNGLAAALSTCASSKGAYANCTWPSSYPLPKAVQGTSVSVTVGGTTTDAYVEFAAQLTSTLAQVNAVLPSNTPTGTGTLTVTYNGTASNAFPITVTAQSFGTFSFNSAGSGPGIMTNAVSNAIVTPFATVKPSTASTTGDYVTIWGTGLGPADPTTEGTAPPTQTNLCGSGDTCPVTVWVAGQKATVTYAGRSGYTAVDQIDYIVPAGVQGCYVQVAVQTGSVIGNFTSIAVDPTGPTCSDGDGINYADISSMVASKGNATVASFGLLSNYVVFTIPPLPAIPWDNDTVTGVIGTYSAATLDTFQGIASVPSAGNCTVVQFEGYPPPVDPALAAVSFLDDGASLSITGPNGTQSVAQDKSGHGYEGLVGGSTIQNIFTPGTPFFLSSSYAISSGNYTVTSPGGSSVGALSSGNIPVSSAAASFVWSNQSTVTASAIPRNAPLTITWTGGDPNGFVDITAIGSTLQTGTPTATTPGALVECMAPTTAGQFVIPTYVLQMLPSTVNSKAAIPPGELLVGPASGGMKITAPTGVDAAYAFYHYIAGVNVNWQ